MQFGGFVRVSILLRVRERGPSILEHEAPHTLHDVSFDNGERVIKFDLSKPSSSRAVYVRPNEDERVM